MNATRNTFSPGFRDGAVRMDKEHREDNSDFVEARDQVANDQQRHARNSLRLVSPVWAAACSGWLQSGESGFPFVL